MDKKPYHLMNLVHPVHPVILLQSKLGTRQDCTMDKKL
jgi:hypothetical protein